jgi:predicted ATP-dependent endonuclease of OLD family
LVIALADIRGDLPLLLLDEPESALHHKALSATADRIQRLGSTHKIPIIAASHSAEFLALDEASLLHVCRDLDTGLATVASVPRSLLSARSKELDPDPTDLLQLVRTFIIVEGEHDRAIIEGLIGSELR